MGMSFLIPGLVILLGVRCFLSAIGIFLIIYGGWKSDRVYDDQEEVNDSDDGVLVVKADEAVTPTVSNNNKNSNSNNKIPVVDEVIQTVGSHVSDAAETAYSAMTGAAEQQPQDGKRGRVQLVYESPTGKYLGIMMIGFGLLFIAFLFDCHEYSTFAANNMMNIFCCFVVLTIMFLHGILLPTAVLDQWIHHHSWFFFCMIIGCYLALGLCIGFSYTDTPFWLPILGALSISVSYPVLWYQRKRGDNYDRTSTENTKPIVFSIGGPCLVFGWYLLWLSMNAVAQDPMNYTYIPIYWTSRTAVSYEGALIILAVYWSVGYAHDEFDQDDDNNGGPRRLRNFFFGRTLEMRVAFVVAWLVFAVAAFLPSYAENPVVAPIVFILIAAQGLAIGVQQVLGYRARDTNKMYKWIRVSTILYVLIAIVTFIHAGIAAFCLVLLGGLVSTIGWSILHDDRKRGKMWMENEQINPNYTVYSWGSLLFPAGLLLLAWGISVP